MSEGLNLMCSKYNLMIFILYIKYSPLNIFEPNYKKFSNSSISLISEMPKSII